MYQFYFNYKNIFDDFSTDYGITIVENPNNKYELNQNIKYKVIYYIDENYINPNDIVSIDIKWSDNNNILGTDSLLNYTISSYNSISINCEVVVIYNKNEEVHTLKLNQNILLKVKIPIEKKYLFNLKYKSTSIDLVYSNMELYKYITYFPIWSSAYKNFYSIASKMISSLTERFNYQIYEMNKISSYKSSIETDMYEYQKYEYSLPIIKKPNYVLTEFGYCYDLGNISVMTFESLLINNFKKNKYDNYINKVNIITSVGVLNLNFQQANHVYIKVPNANQYNKYNLLITGINENFEYIQESLLIEYGIPAETYNKFILINEISSNILNDKIILYISNYIDNGSIVSSHSFDKLIVSRKGIYFTPIFELKDNELIVKNGDNNLNTEYIFHLPFIPEKFLISETLDVILLYNNHIYTSKLMLNYNDIKNEYNSSLNNNDFIYVEEDNVKLNDYIYLYVNIKALKEEYKIQYIKISLIREGLNDLYLNNDGNFVSDPDTWIDIQNINNEIKINILKNTDVVHVFKLELLKYDKLFYSLVYSNKLKCFKILNNIDTLFLHNKQLFIEHDNETFNIKPIKMFFLCSKNKLYFQYDFKQVELIYESETK